MPDRPGHVGTIGDVDSLNDLDGFLGLTLISTPDTRGGQPFEGVLKKASRPNGSPFYWLQAKDGSKKIISSLTTAQTLVEPISLQGVTVGTGINPVSRSIGKQSEADLARLFGLGSGSTSTASAPAFSSTQAAQTQAEAFARQQAELAAAAQVKAAAEARAFQEEQNRLAEEAALKRGRLSTLTDLIQSFVGAQSQARDTLANLQPDPFRFAAVAGGIAPFGTTPQQGFQQQLQQFASAPIPTADPNASLPSIESAIQGLTGANVPLPPQVFGAAGGATIPAPPPGQSVNVKVGEKGEEILRITAQGVEVIPIMAAAQEGGFFPFKEIEFDKESLLPALFTSGIFSNIASDVAFKLPVSAPGPRGGFGAGSGGAPFTGRGLRILDQFGIQPNLIRFAPRGSTADEVAAQGVFFRDPTTGQLQGVTDQQFRDAQFNVSDITLVDPSQRGQFEFGANFTGRPRLDLDQRSPFTKLSQPIVEPTTGVLLPAPFTVARQLNQLRLTNPTLFNLMLSAYKSADVPVEAVLNSIQQSLPFGQERTLTGLR